MIWITYNNHYQEKQDFPGQEAIDLFEKVRPFITRPSSHGEILHLMSLRNRDGSLDYHNRMFHRLFAAGYFVNGSERVSSLYLPREESKV